MPTLVIPKTRSVSVRREGDRVVVVEDGQLLIDMPHDAALALAQAIVAQARLIDEERHADKIAYDQGILLRLGIKLGLTNNPDIQHEAARVAAWDLRRYLPGGIRSQEHVGTPALIKHPPKGVTPHG